jgi:RNA-binding protein
MDPLTGKQRRKLKSLAHHLKPVVYIGKLGLTDSLVQAADQALSDHELIKVKFIDFKEEKRAIIEEVAEKTGAELIGLIGNIAIVFRQNPDVENQRIVI